MNPKEFFSRWKEGIANSTPQQQMKAQIVGTWGTIWGLIFAGTLLIINGYWYFIIVMIFTIFLQAVSLVGLKQKYKGIQEAMNMLKEETEESKNGN